MSLKVLIADPDWRFTQQASSFLESHAHLVIRESRPSRVRELTERWGPDLVIIASELVESEEDLFETIYSVTPRPAVLLTGWLDRYDRIWRAWQKGGDELIIKPVLRSQELHEAIVTALENAATGVRRHPPAPAAVSA